jgi:hypothetical protein
MRIFISGPGVIVIHPQHTPSRDSRLSLTIRRRSSDLEQCVWRKQRPASSGKEYDPTVAQNGIRRWTYLKCATLFFLPPDHSWDLSAWTTEENTSLFGIAGARKPSSKGTPENKLSGIVVGCWGRASGVRKRWIE